MRRASLVLALALLGLPLAAEAQWPLGSGGAWAKLSVFHHRTDSRYTSTGEVQPFIGNDAESRSTAVFLDVGYGLTDRLELWAQVPWYDLSFDDAFTDRSSSGFADVRLFARVHVLDLAGGAVPIAVRAGAKAPIRESPIDAEIIPVGQGQWDVEAWLEGGVSFWPVPAYAVLWLGYRWRMENETTTRHPGDERLVLAEVGGTLFGPLGAKVVLDGMWGENGSVQGVQLGQDAQRLVQLQSGLSWALTESTSLEGALRIPVSGRNVPTGNQLVLSVFHRREGG